MNDKFNGAKVVSGQGNAYAKYLSDDCDPKPNKVSGGTESAKKTAPRKDTKRKKTRKRKGEDAELRLDEHFSRLALLVQAISEGGFSDATISDAGAGLDQELSQQRDTEQRGTGPESFQQPISQSIRP